MYRFVYSSHASHAAALAAVEDYYASGEIDDADAPVIRFERNRWRVMLRG